MMGAAITTSAAGGGEIQPAPARVRSTSPGNERRRHVIFREDLSRFDAGEMLLNVVDKDIGFGATAAQRSNVDHDGSATLAAPARASPFSGSRARCWSSGPSTPAS